MRLTTLIILLALSSPVLAQGERPSPPGELGEPAPRSAGTKTRPSSSGGSTMFQSASKALSDLGTWLSKAVTPAPRPPELPLVLAVRSYQPDVQGSEQRTEIRKRGSDYVLREMAPRSGMGLGGGAVKSERILSATEVAALEADLARFREARPSMRDDGDPTNGWTHVGVEVPGTKFELETNFKVEKGVMVFREKSDYSAAAALLTDRRIFPSAGVNGALGKIR